MTLADIHKRSTQTSNGKPAATGAGIAQTLREAGPGVLARLTLHDGKEVEGQVSHLDAENVELDSGARIDLRLVRRVHLEFSSPSSGDRGRSRQRERAA
jgi:hypothetical protein